MRLAATEMLDSIPAARAGAALAALTAADDDPNPTMKAIAARYAKDPGWAVQARVPFSSTRKWSGVTFARHGSWLLGAPAVVGAGLPAAVAADVARHEAEGHRVLLLATTPQPLDGNQPPGGTAPAALLVLTEELRDEAAPTVRYLTGQGVTIKVLSGDAPRAVAAIARSAGIPACGDPVDASGLTDEQMAGAIETAGVFGRVRPAQKLAAVTALQAAGHVVAMIGDGVNDVQALKQADLGIAMGSGSDASRSVARVVLLDGTFAAIPQLLGEARRVIANIERVAGLFVTKTVYAAIIAVIVGAVAIPFPFYPRHLTIISTLAIGVPGFFLALAGGAPRARPGFTRRVLAFTIPAGIAAAAATLGSYALARAADGTSAQAARTAAMLALFTVSLWVLGIVAGRSTWRIPLILAMAAFLVPLLAIPLARATFAVQLPPAVVLLQIAGAVPAAIAGLTLWRRLHPAPDD
jgi:cation-transporting ATPase E